MFDWKKGCEIGAETAKGDRKLEKARWWQQCLAAVRRPLHFWKVGILVK